MSELANLTQTFTGYFNNDDTSSEDVDNVDEDNTLLDHSAIQCSVLSRIVEPLRFQLEETVLDEKVTPENLEQLLKVEMLRKNYTLEDATDILESDIPRVWEGVTVDGPVNLTYRELLAYDLPEYPVTTQKQRAKLNFLAQQKNVVQRKEVRSYLSLSNDDPILQCIFREHSAIPSVTLEEIAKAMGTHPRKVMFARHCALDMIRSQRNMASFLPFLMVFLVTLFLLPMIHIDEAFTLYRTIWWPTTDDWLNFCPDGVESQCQMIKRNIPDDLHTLFDTQRWFNLEMIEQLWNWNGMNVQTAAEMPYGGSWLVGGLVLRVSPQMYSDDDDEIGGAKPLPITASCADLGLTQSFIEETMPQIFTCDSMVHTFIPFNLPRQQARWAARNFTLQRSPTQDSVAALQFGIWRPKDGLLAWVTVTATIPQGGNIVSRSTVKTIVPYAHQTVLVFLIMQSSLLLFNLIVAFFYRNTSASKPYLFFFNKNLIPPIIQTIIISIAYARLANMTPVENLTQAHYISKGLDQMAADFTSGLDLVGVWLLIFMSLSVRYFRDVMSVGLVIRLFRIALSEIIGLLVVFSFIYLGFVLVAIILFGANEKIFSAFLPAHMNLIQYFWGSQNYDALAEQNPILGGAFYYIYNIFVNYFALNLLVAVLTAPLKDVRDAANLHLELYDMMTKRVSRLPPRERWGFNLRKLFIPIINILCDSVPFVRFNYTWISFCQAVNDLYGWKPEYDIRQQLNAACCVLFFKANLEPDDSWNTTLVNAAAEFNVVPDVVSMNLIKVAIMYSTQNSVIRDARLMKCLIAYDQLTTGVSSVISQQNEQQEKGRQMEEALRKTKSTLKKATLKQQDTEATGSMMKEERTENFDATTSSLVATTSSTTPTPAAQPLRRGRAASKIDQRLGRIQQRGKVILSSRVKASQLKFNFATHLARLVKNAVWFPLYYVIVLAMFLLYVIPITASVQKVSWLNENLHGGLRDFPYIQACSDDSCSSGFMHIKTFKDAGHINDVFQYFQVCYQPRVFPDVLPYEYSGNPASSSSPAGPEERFPVYWDKYLRRVGPVVVRQLRGRQIPCKLPGTKQDALDIPGSDPTRIDQIYALKCYASGDDLATAEIPQSTTNNAATQLPAYAYQYRNWCYEIGEPPVRGYLHTYPCEGYSVNISSAQDLMKLQQVGWLDNSTRFISISAVFELGESKLEYDMYFELADGGGTGFGYTFSTPHIENKLLRFGNIAYILLFIDLGVFFLKLARYLYNLCIAKNILKAENTKAKIPKTDVCVLILLLLVRIFIGQPYLRQSLQAVLLTNFVFWTFLKYNLFPTAQFFTRKASTVKRVLVLTARYSIIILPFYCVFFMAFTFSGHVFFGRNVLGFANLRLSAISIGKGFMAGLDFDAQFAERPILALYFNGLFFIVALTVLANIVLSLITGAADEARSEAALQGYLESMAQYCHSPIYSGPLFEAWLGASLFDTCLKQCLAKCAAKHMPVPFTITNQGRFGLPIETLFFLPSLGCCQLAEIAKVLQLLELPPRIVMATIVFVAEQNMNYLQSFPMRADEDDATEMNMMMALWKKGAASSPLGKGKDSFHDGSAASEIRTVIDIQGGDHQESSSTTRQQTRPPPSDQQEMETVVKLPQSNASENKKQLEEEREEAAGEESQLLTAEKREESSEL